MSPVGPVMQLGNLVNTGGSVAGASKPDLGGVLAVVEADAEHLPGRGRGRAERLGRGPASRR